MNFKNINLVKLGVLYGVFMIPAVAMFLYENVHRPDSTPKFMHAVLSLVVSAFMSFATPAFIALGLWGIYSIVVFMCSNDGQ